MSAPTKEQIVEYMKALASPDSPKTDEWDTWNAKDLKEFFIEHEVGAFMLVGFMLGRGHTIEGINTTLGDGEALAKIIDGIDFTA